MLRRWLVLPVVLIAALVLLGAEPGATFAPNPSLSITPAFQRVEVGPTEQVHRAVTLTTTTDLTILAVESPCRCVAVTTAFPLKVQTGTSTTLDLLASGALPGLKTLTLRTTAGSLPFQVQVISAGLGDGLSAWKAIGAKAAMQKLGLVVIVHDLHGEIRNCGCSGGSLGGIDHLAALPVAASTWAPGTSLRFVLTGDVDGHRPGIESALADSGWRRDPAVVVSANFALDLQNAAILAVIPTMPTAINHRKLITPVLTGGMTAEVLLVDAAGQIVDHETLPIDRTLPSDSAILRGFPDRLSSAVVDANPSASCQTCHATAHQTWATSRHARAWDSLRNEDRTDACIACHSTPVATGVAPGVSCLSCHTGAAAHAASPTTVKTGVRTDCRSCHDARHDPGFDPVKAWMAVAHGK